MSVYTVEVETQFEPAVGNIHVDQLRGKPIQKCIGRTIKINTHYHNGMPLKTIGTLTRVLSVQAATEHKRPRVLW